MPRLPTIAARTAPGVVRQPRQTPEQFGAAGFRGISEAAGVLQGISDRMDAAQDRIDLGRAKGDYEKRVKGARLDMETQLREPGVKNEDFTNQVNIFNDLEKTIRKDVLSGVNLDVGNALMASIESSNPLTQFDVEKRGLELYGEKQMADLLVSQDELLDDAGKVDQSVRDERVEEFNERVDAVRGGVSTLNAPQAEKLKIAFKEEMDKRTVADVESLMIEDASGTLELIKGGVYDDLPQKTLNALERAAETQISADATKFKRDEKIRIDAVEGQMLTSFDAGKLTFPEVNAANIPTTKKIAWRKRLQKQAKDENAFLVSDPLVHAQVFTSISKNPGLWDPDMILEFVGNGLSTKDSLKARKLMDDLVKGDPNNPTKFRPLQLAMAAAERARARLLFIDAANKNDPSALIENEIQAQVVRDAILLANEKGEDPILAFQKAMKSYLAPTVFRWGELISAPLSNFGFVKPESNLPLTRIEAQEEQQLELDARRLMQTKGNIPPTEENVKRTMDYLKKKKAAAK